MFSWAHHLNISVEQNSAQDSYMLSLYELVV